MADDFYEIDKFALDVEFENQPRLYGEHADELAEAMREYEVAKGNKELIYSKLYLAISANPEAYDLPVGSRGGVTQDTIKAAVICQAKYQKAVEKVVETEYRVNLLKGNCRTLDHKKTSLEHLDSLNARDYFARPKETPETRERRAMREMDNAYGVKRRAKR